MLKIGDINYEIVDLHKGDMYPSQLGSRGIAVNNAGVGACGAYPVRGPQGVLINPSAAYAWDGAASGLHYDSRARLQWAVPHGINDDGDVVGKGIPKGPAASERFHAFVNHRIIPSLDSTAWRLQDIAYDITNEGVVAMSSNRMRNLIWGTGQTPVATACFAVQDQGTGAWTVVPAPGALEFPPWMHFTYPARIKDGMMCGEGRYKIGSNNKVRGFLFSTSRQSVLPGILPNNQGDFRAVDMNGRVVIGNGTDEGNNITGFLSKPWWCSLTGDLVSNFLIEGLYSPSVFGINSSGLCVGQNGRGQAVVWPTFDDKPIVIDNAKLTGTGWTAIGVLRRASDLGHLIGDGAKTGDTQGTTRAVMLVPV